jgi:hypothetical protein
VGWWELKIGFEVLTAVVMIVAMFWDIAPCSWYVIDVSEKSRQKSA